MRALALLLVAATATAHAEPDYDPPSPRLAATRIRQARRDWPKLDATFTARGFDTLLLSGLTPCVALDNRPAAPPIDDVSASSSSPNGDTLVVVTTLDGAAAKALGAGEDAATLLVVFDGPSGKVWARSLDSFRLCNYNLHEFQWSSDGKRVYIATDTGHGNRVALVDVTARAIRFTAFTGIAPPSPRIEHVAWLPWFSGFPFAEGDRYGDELSIDDRRVWGSQTQPDTHVWNVAWRSESTLVFCGESPRQAPQRFEVSVGGPVRKAKGDCSTRD